MDKTALAKRMKENYEIRTKQKLTRRLPTIIRLDGKAFHTYTRGLNKPFDEGLIEDMMLTTKFLCENIQGVKCGYTQSDEISLLLTDFDKITSDAWFDYSVQKMTSIAASMATAKFNQLRVARELDRRDWDMSDMYIIATNEKRSAYYGLQEDMSVQYDIKNNVDIVLRNKWEAVETPMFGKDRESISKLF